MSHFCAFGLEIARIVRVGLSFDWKLFDNVKTVTFQSNDLFRVVGQEADRAELRGRFSEDAALSEKEAMESGKAVPLSIAFDYLEARALGNSARRPRARAWRASK